MVSSKPVAVVTGSSSGIGFETALTLARNGFATYATMRNLSKAAEIQSIASKENLPIIVKQLDVTKNDSVGSAIAQIMLEAGRIDVVVNNAGYGLTGAFEDLSIDEIEALYETNFYGVIRVTQAVLPIMRRQQAGKIINISSAAGPVAYPGASAYVSTKLPLKV